jgi:hypothetical protein
MTSAGRVFLSVEETKHRVHRADQGEGQGEAGAAEKGAATAQLGGTFIETIATASKQEGLEEFKTASSLTRVSSLMGDEMPSRVLFITHQAH